MSTDIEITLKEYKFAEICSHTDSEYKGFTRVEKWVSEDKVTFCLKRVPQRSSHRLIAEAKWMQICSSTIATDCVPRFFGLFSSKEESILVSEWQPFGDVFGKSSKDFPRGVEKWIRSALTALKRLDDAKYAHTDISQENMSCQPDGRCVLLDFEHAQHASTTVQGNRLATKRRYHAPEVAKGQQVWLNAADLYSFGVVCCMILLGTEGVPLKVRADNDMQPLARETSAVMQKLAQQFEFAEALVIPTLALVPSYRSHAYGAIHRDKS